MTCQYTGNIRSPNFADTEELPETDPLMWCCVKRHDLYPLEQAVEYSLQSRTVVGDIGHPEPSFRQENRPRGARVLPGDSRDETCGIDAPSTRLLLGRLHPCRADLLFTGRQPDYARFPR